MASRTADREMDIRQHAIVAVAQAGALNLTGAVCTLRNRTGATLADCLKAVRWAVEQIKES